MMLFQPGQVINETYRVDRPLGSGGMADVYVVTHMRMPRQFALKVMRIDGSVREAFLERFNREGEILASLKHPHIVDVMDRHQTPDGNPYLVMELLDGEDLAAFLARTGPLSAAAALKICNQAGEALKAAHQIGIVHRDLKPSNIFLSKASAFPNYVKILDFGIAKLTANQRTPMTAQASLMGTPGYMAPEQALGQIDKIDPRTDQFSLAVVLYEMISGRQPFRSPDNPSTFAILHRTVHETPLPLEHPQINRAVMRALSKSSDDRFPTIVDFLAAAGATNETIVQSSSAPMSPQSTLGQNGEMTIPPIRRAKHFRGVMLGMVVLAAMCVGSILLAVKGGLFLPTKAGARLVSKPPVVAPNKDAPIVPPQPVTPVELPSKMAVDAAAAVDRPSSDSPPAPTETVKIESSKTLKTVKKTLTKAATKPNLFIITGVNNRLVEIGIRACLNANLTDLGLNEASVIKLERSGTLQVTVGPKAVLDSNLDVCLQGILAKFPSASLPESVTIRVTR